MSGAVLASSANYQRRLRVGLRIALVAEVQRDITSTLATRADADGSTVLSRTSCGEAGSLMMHIKVAGNQPTTCLPLSKVKIAADIS